MKITQLFCMLALFLVSAGALQACNSDADCTSGESCANGTCVPPLGFRG